MILLSEIKAKQEVMSNEHLETGGLLRNIYSGQKVAIVNAEGETVTMVMQENLLRYPKKILWAHFEKSEPGD